MTLSGHGGNALIHILDGCTRMRKEMTGRCVRTSGGRSVEEGLIQSTSCLVMKTLMRRRSVEHSQGAAIIFILICLCLYSSFM